MDFSPILVTGGCGFIGTNLIRLCLEKVPAQIINLDALTYAANTYLNQEQAHNTNYKFIHGDICDQTLINSILQEHRPMRIIHFAAESHVDRSIESAAQFLLTNVMGTHSILQASTNYYETLNAIEKEKFCFIHISTDEVYGSLKIDDLPFTTNSNYHPNNPYAASKASADHLVNAWHVTHNLPVTTLHLSNNYGPYQYPEKLIPLTIKNALTGNLIKIYGDGMQIRDWLYVTDSCNGIMQCMQNPNKSNQIYNLGGGCELNNNEVVTEICNLLDEIYPCANNKLRHPISGNFINSYNELITHIADRKGHDRRYAIDYSSMLEDYNWHPKVKFIDGIQDTINWYMQKFQHTYSTNVYQTT